MHFVNAERRPQRVTLPSLRQPRLVRPLELAVVPHDGGIIGRRLKEEAIRVSLEDDPAVQVPNFELVLRPLAHSGDENLPHPRRAQRAHLVEMTIPTVKVTDYADALGIGRPHCEAGAGHTIDGAQLRPELLVYSALVTLAKEKQIRFPQRRQERIRIARAADAALLVGDDQVVSINPARLGGGAFEEAGRS